MKKSRDPKISLKSRLVTKAVLRGWALPVLDHESDKSVRGELTVVAGSYGMPGAAALAAIAALRAGAGKLQIVTPRCVAATVAQMVPESLVVGLDEEREGVLSRRAGKHILSCIKNSRAVLIGCGMESNQQSSARLLAALKIVLRDSQKRTLVVDASAMTCLKDCSKHTSDARHNIIITPHAGEMSCLTGHTKDYIQKNSEDVAIQFARRFGVTVVLKGRKTVITDGKKLLFHNLRGNTGLGTSGSGDVLAGLITGLAARGAEPVQAAIWGVHLHALAGEELAERIGPLGYLARELSGEIPKIMASISNA